MSFGGIQAHPGRAYILLLPLVMAGCFQLDTLDHTVPTPPTPPVIEYETLHPAVDKVITFNLDGENNAEFYMPDIFDANGPEELQLFGRWFVNYDPEVTIAGNAFTDISRRTESEDEDAGTTDEDCLCRGCCWEARFSVPITVFRGPGCYQILALISDSRFLENFGQLHETESPTIPARAIWWVWAYDSAVPDSPAFDLCADPVEANP